MEMVFSPLIKGTMCETYDVFARRKIFSEPPQGWSLVSWDKLIKFVVLFVDEESPASKERDFDVRKKVCYKLLKEVEIQEVEIEGYFFRTLIGEYFKLAHSTTYELWLSLKIAFHAITSQMREPLSGDNAEDQARIRSRTAQEARKILEELQAQEAILFKDSRLQKMIAQRVEEDSAIGWAERFAV